MSATRRLVLPLAILAIRAGRAIELAFGLVIGLLLRAMAGLYRIEVQEIWAERIGHLALEPEIFLCRRAERAPFRGTTVFYVGGSVCNEYLMSLWRRELRVWPRWLLRPLYRAGRRFLWLQLLPIEWDVEHVSIESLDRHPAHLTFRGKDLSRGEELLRALGVREGQPYVCLAVRDSNYLRTHFPERDWSYHDYRDSSIKSYVAMAEWLASAGYAVLRMGSSVSTDFPSDRADVIDYANSSLRSDFGDVYLFAHCDFCISSSTGMDSLVMAFRRPLGLVNVAGATGFQIGGPLRMVMLKQIVDIATDAPIGPSDPRFERSFGLYRSKDFEELGVRVKENTSDELLAFTVAMVDLLAGRDPDAIGDEAMERVIQKIISTERLSFRLFH